VKVAYTVVIVELVNCPIDVKYRFDASRSSEHPFGAQPQSPTGGSRLVRVVGGGGVGRKGAV